MTPHHVKRIELRLGCARVLSKSAERLTEQVGEDAIAGFEPGHTGSDGLDGPGDIDAESVDAWRSDADEEPDELRTRLDAVEVGPIDGCRVDPDEDLALPGGRDVDLLDADDVRFPIPISNGGLHGRTLAEPLVRLGACGRRWRLPTRGDVVPQVASSPSWVMDTLQPPSGLSSVMRFGCIVPACIRRGAQWARVRVVRAVRSARPSALGPPRAGPASLGPGAPPASRGRSSPK